ncbi:MAG TPA: hypothetical protein VNL38_03860 [Candidatus Nitrosotenuis sp.]|nr:hypothetical protein [Candidatus Nitrosotenuis sp.]
MDINPHHAGWYHFSLIWESCNKKDYEKALEHATRVNMPGMFWQPLVVASLCGLLGRRAEAAAAAKELRKLDENIEVQARYFIECWHYSSGLMDTIVEGLRKAGLEILDEKEPAPSPATRTKTLPSSTDSGAARADEGFWIAVLPFKYSGANAELTALAEGLTEEIVTGLSRFSYLRVIARSSTVRLKGAEADVRTLGKELGARYVMEGSIRQAGAKLRIAVQLVDASTGAHLWAETFDSSFSAESVFEIQDNLVPRIVSTIADAHGILPRSMGQALRNRAPDTLSPYEAVLRSFSYFERVTPEELAAAQTGLELAVQKDSAYADAWAMLALLCVQDYAQGFNVHADSLPNGASAARRAIEIAPSNHLAYSSLAQSLFFQKEFQSFRNAAERAIALNPMDGNSLALLGEMIAYSGEWERGLALAERAKQLNPHHPGWYWHVDFNYAYRQRDYHGALSFALKMNVTSNWGAHALMAAACGQLGDREAGEKALRELLRVRPDIAAYMAREANAHKWFDAAHVKHLLDGLRKAGLAIPYEKEDSAAPLAATSREPRADSGSTSAAIAEKSIAVLPFVNRSADAGNEYFSDGLTEEIIANLSRVEALKVISRNSSMALKGTTKDTPTIAKELGVTHIVSGSVRRAGDALRVTAELIEAATDSPLWSEVFSGTMQDVFGIQEEIARKIVAALKIKLSDSGEHRAAERPINHVLAYDCYLRARQEIYEWSPESQDRAIRLVDQALSIVGENPLLLSTRGQILWTKVNIMLDPDERHMEEAADCARRALAVKPHDYSGLFLRGLVAALRGQTAGAIADMFRAHQQSPSDPNVLAEFCRFAHASGIEAEDCIEELIKIDPLTPVTWLVVATSRYVKGGNSEAAAHIRRLVAMAPRVSWLHAITASAMAQAGEREEAVALLRSAEPQMHSPIHLSFAQFLRSAYEGDAEQAASHMTPLLTKAGSYLDHAAHAIAAAYAVLGRADESLEWLRIGMNHGYINYPFLSKHDRLLDPIRSDSRFAQFLEEVKSRWESLGQSLPSPLRLQAL